MTYLLFYAYDVSNRWDNHMQTPKLSVDFVTGIENSSSLEYERRLETNLSSF